MKDTVQDPALAEVFIRIENSTDLSRHLFFNVAANHLKSKDII